MTSDTTRAEGLGIFARDDKELVAYINDVRVWIDYDDVDQDAAEAVARLISSAANNHAALVEALKEAEFELSRCYVAVDPTSPGGESCEETALRVIRAVLAAVNKGEKP